MKDVLVSNKNQSASKSGAKTRPSSCLSDVVPQTSPEGPRAVETLNRRLLFVVEESPDTIERKSYGERLAGQFAQRGASVVVMKRTGQTLLPMRPCTKRKGEPLVLCVDQEEVPLAPTLANRALVTANTMTIPLERALREEGPFDALWAEGPLCGLVAQGAAQRAGVPFVLVLPDCEVRTRNNRLSREEMYWAELEHFLALRAHEIVVQNDEVAAAVQYHYQVRDVVRVISAPLPSVTAPEGGGRLLSALGLSTAPVVVLARSLTVADSLRCLSVTENNGAPVPEAVVLGAEGVVVRCHGHTRPLSPSPVSGLVLAALLAHASVVISLSNDDPRSEEARALGSTVVIANNSSSQRLEDVLGASTSVAASEEVLS
jgi:hypothetical protein